MAKLIKRGGTYHALYYDRDGRRRWRTTHCSDKRAAQAAADRFEREAHDPDYTPANTTTLTDILEALVKDREENARAGKRSPETVRMYRVKAGHLKRVFEVTPQGTHVPFMVERLHAKHVDAYISQRRSEGAKDPTIAKELVALRSALKLAKRRGDWSGDLDAVMPHGFSGASKPVERFLRREELPLLLPHLTADHAARVAFAIATSANLGEASRALREDIGEHAVFVRGTKRTSRRRIVPIVSPEQRQLIEYATKHAKGVDGKLFRYDGGFHSALERACDDAKIPHCTSNDLRRTFAQWMRERGVPAELVAPAMGHADTRMVERVYGRMPADVLAARLAQALGLATHVQQTVAADSDFADVLDSGPREKFSKINAEGGTRTRTSLRPGDFKSLRLLLPSPRKYARNRDYASPLATAVQQHNAAEGLDPTLPRARKGGR